MLCYCHVPGGNFGDELNPWLWSRLAPEVCAERPDILFYSIGTILSDAIPTGPRKVVFGSGWADSRPPVCDERWHIYCLRGPLTAAALKLPPAKAITDPALLIRQCPWPAPPKRWDVSFMPHHWSLQRADWPALCPSFGLHCIDPRHSVETVIHEILQSKLLLTEAMHGAIVADALRVPWIPIRLDQRFNADKWRDWEASVGLSLVHHPVPPLQTVPLRWNKTLDYGTKRALAALGLGRRDWAGRAYRTSRPAEIAFTLKELTRLSVQARPHLTEEKRLRELEARLLEALAQLRADWTKW